MWRWKRAFQKERARDIVVLEWILFAFGIVFLVTYNVSLMNTYDEDIQPVNVYTSLVVQNIVIPVLLMSWLGKTILLTIGVHERHHSLCRLWHLTNTLAVPFLIIGILTISFYEALSNSVNVVVISVILVAVYRIYAIIKIRDYVRILKTPEKCSV